MIKNDSVKLFSYVWYLGASQVHLKTSRIETTLHSIWDLFSNVHICNSEKQTYTQKSVYHTEIYKSQITFKLCGVEWFQISAL